MQKISILGCGWLGLPLAIELISKGYSVKGSTTTPHKIKELESKKIIGFQIELFPDSIVGDISGFLKDSDVLILDIPPKAKSENITNFTEKLKVLKPFIEASSIGIVLFTSSISVYGNQGGIITEEKDLLPETANGKQLVSAEQILTNSAAYKTTVVRFGGLTSSDRHPVYHLAGKTDLPDPYAPINLIHRDDCIGILISIIRQEAWGEVFNAVAPSHPSRIDYYQVKSLEFNLPEPKFSAIGNAGKTVSSEKLIAKLGYTFIHPEP